jgi:DedD protein
MEKKKLLIVAVSVGVVLLIIIAIPLLMIAPRQNNALPAAQDWVTVVEPAIRVPEPVAEPAPVVQPVESALPKPEEPAQITLTVPVPQTAAAVPDTPVTPTHRPSAIKTPAAKPAVAQSAPAKPAPKEAAKPAADKSKTYNSYWVQTGAFSTKIRAESAKESLASKGITSIIDNRDIDGKTWYRVRVGPYTSETEANYWLALVKSIDGFADSQVRLSQVLR